MSRGAEAKKEIIARTGHGHVENPHLFANEFARLLLLIRPDAERIQTLREALFLVDTPGM